MVKKMAIIGEKDAVLGFKTLGIDVFDVRTPEEAARQVIQLSKQDYAVIFITESIAGGIGSTMERFRNVPFPAIIPISGNQGVTGYGMDHVRANAERAVGADILFHKEG
nr:V-type ATP synthase subunit F [Maliibacterium massiliense]